MGLLDDVEAGLPSDRWLALSIGNSRLHWGEFLGDDLQHLWDTPHLAAAEIQQLIATQFTQKPDLYIASVVPQQEQLWQHYPAAHCLTLEHVPLKGLYSTLGIDRALALWGAIDIVGSPVLVIDAGTALTFTGADGDRQLVGGAILPGLGLQFQMLSQATAALPDVATERLALPTLPSRWALNTTDAIASGILYTLVAGVREFVIAWWQQFPDSPVMLRGGDRDRLYADLTAYAPELASKIIVEPRLIFWGMRSVRGWEVRSKE